jgi:hypothetical protein
MSPQRIFAKTALVLASIAAWGTVALAQTVVVDPRTGAFYEQRGPGGRPAQRYQPAPGQRVPPGYYPGMPVQQAPPQPGFSLRRLFGIEDEEQPRQAEEPRRRAPVRASRPERPRAPAAPAVAKKKPKVDPSTHVVVFGDSLADLVSRGLDEEFSDRPDIDVIDKARGDMSLTRAEPEDWPKLVQDVLDDGQKVTVAVVMLGAKDRQAIKEGETTHEPLTERWRQLYRERVDAVARAFQERSVPLVWVGLPPMRNDKLSADLIEMNEIYRESVERLGGTYVDIWPGFVNEENRYTVTGPDVEGQQTRLRTNDGVLFTSAGARKVAHFADTEIKRILEGIRTGAPVAAVPATGGPTEEAPTIEQLINASIGELPEPSGTPPLQPKPIAGPVLPLTRQEVSPGGTLVSGRPKLNSDSTYTLQKALREGVAPPPRPGRADDFRWPRS